jgi:predicted RecB family nuclease
MWSDFLGRISQYPNAPLYHYGSYEPRAIMTLSKRYGTESTDFEKVGLTGFLGGCKLER